MTHLATRIVTALLARDSKDATYKFALLRPIVLCVTEQLAHKRIDQNPFAREAGAGYGQGAPSTRETSSTRKQEPQDDETGRKRIHQKKREYAIPPSLSTIFPDACSNCCRMITLECCDIQPIHPTQPPYQVTKRADCSSPV